MARKVIKGFLVLLLLLAFNLELNAQPLKEKLLELGFEKIDSLQIQNKRYAEAFVFFLKQPVDPKNPEKGSFLQRIILRHSNFNKPMVLVTEGYNADYALYPFYEEEIAKNLDANLLVVEHRFFSESMPENQDWKALTLENATHDLHTITTKLKNIYQSAWLATGISKGGQTSLYYRYFYPGDVAATVAYVAPLNFSEADPRVQHFLDTVGTADCRKKLLNLQFKLLNNRDLFRNQFEDSTSQKGFTFDRAGGIDRAFEMNVLETGFAYWQWYPYSCTNFPDTTVSNDEIFTAWIAATGYDFFADQSLESMQAFFYQALTEMGFYTYDTKPFGNLIHYQKKPDFKHGLPVNTKARFKKGLNKKVNRFLQKSGNQIIYVYGGYDAWSSTAVMPSKKTNAFKIIKPEGSHATRIRHFDEETQKQVYDTLRNWLGLNES
jgi:hypothetical protein